MNKISDKLKDKINNIPELPGIYKIIDFNGRIIYIYLIHNIKMIRNISI